jgi:hypothetical protein
MDQSAGATMNTVSLLLLVTILATRIPLLLWDRPIKARQALVAGSLQVLVVLALLKGPYGYWILLALLTLGNLVWYLAEGHFPSSLQRVRLATLLGFTGMASVMASTGFNLSFRDLHPTISFIRPWFSPIGLLEQLPWNTVLLIGAGFLLCQNEANLLIRHVINQLELKPKESESLETGGLVINQEYQRGRVIGMLERATLFVLVFTGQYGAMGFILAAKAMARFKTLDDRDFAEYFLVGTLLSVAIAGGLALAVKKALE